MEDTYVEVFATEAGTSDSEGWLNIHYAAADVIRDKIDKMARESCRHRVPSS